MAFDQNTRNRLQRFVTVCKAMKIFGHMPRH